MNTSQKLWHLLIPAQRRVAIVLLGLMAIAAVLEALGIGLVIPVVALMTQGDLGSRYPALVPCLRAPAVLRLWHRPTPLADVGRAVPHDTGATCPTLKCGFG